MPDSAAPAEILQAPAQVPEQARPDIDKISDLLRGKPKEDVAPVEGTPSDDQAEPERAEDAPAAEPEKVAIDYGMKIPMQDGVPVTLGALKDAYQAQATSKLDLIDQQNKIMAMDAEARTLLKYVKDLPDDVREAAMQAAVVDYKRETEILGNAIPETRTAAGAKEVRERLYALAGEYKVSKHMVDSISDATTIKMMHDFAVLKAAVKAARLNVKPLRSDTAKATRTSATPPNVVDAAIAKAKTTRSQGDQVAAIDHLLRSSGRGR